MDLKPDIDKLYSREQYLEVCLGGLVCSVSLVGLDGEPDCMIGHFGHNFFFRTRHGVNRKKYKTFKGMMTAIEKKCLTDGQIFEYWNIKGGGA